jgi:hypothetical protein
MSKTKQNGKKLPNVGDEIVPRGKVTRLGKNTYGTSDTVTVLIHGQSIPVTIDASYLADDA